MRRSFFLETECFTRKTEGYCIEYTRLIHTFAKMKLLRSSENKLDFPLDPGEALSFLVLEPSGKNTTRFVNIANITVIHKLSAVMKRLLVVHFTVNH